MFAIFWLLVGNELHAGEGSYKSSHGSFPHSTEIWAGPVWLQESLDPLLPYYCSSYTFINQFSVKNTQNCKSSHLFGKNRLVPGFCQPATKTFALCRRSKITIFVWKRCWKRGTQEVHRDWTPRQLLFNSAPQPGRWFAKIENFRAEVFSVWCAHRLFNALYSLICINQCYFAVLRRSCWVLFVMWCQWGDLEDAQMGRPTSPALPSDEAEGVETTKPDLEVMGLGGVTKMKLLMLLEWLLSRYILEGFLTPNEN